MNQHSEAEKDEKVTLWSDLIHVVSKDLSSTVVSRWVPLHIDGVVGGRCHSGNWRSRRYCSVTNKQRWDTLTLKLTIFLWTCGSSWLSWYFLINVCNSSFLTCDYSEESKTTWKLCQLWQPNIWWWQLLYSMLTYIQTLIKVLLNKGFRTVYVQIGAWAVLGSEGTPNFPGPAWFSAATLKM